MNRIEFLKKLSGATGFMLLPIKKLPAKKKTWLTPISRKRLSVLQWSEYNLSNEPGGIFDADERTQ